MKRFAVVGGICASFLLGAALTALAQDEHQNDRPDNARQDDRQTNAQQDHPENRQDQARPQEQAKPQEQARPEDRQNQQPESGNRRDTTPQSEGRQPQNQQSGDRNMQGRENYDNGHSNQGRQEDQAHGQPQAGADRDQGQRHIADTDFRAHFGREHHFAPGHLREYSGRQGFAYGGHTFALVDAWPAGWSYDDDDCYVDYVDGSYWLFDDRHPGVRVALILIG